MAKGSSAPVTTTNVTKTDLSPEQTELLNLAMPHLREFSAGGGPKLPDFSGVAGFDPMQTAGQEQVLDAASGYSGALTNAQGAYEGAVPGLDALGGQAAQTYSRLTSGELLNPESNPALRAHMDNAVSSAAAPIWQGLSESVLPNIRGSAVTTGYGGSRQGIAEGIASGRAAQEVGRQGQNIVSDLANRAYGQGLTAMTQGLGMTGDIQKAQTAGADASRTAAGLAGEQINPALWTSGVGDVRQGQAQSLLDEQTARWNYEQNLPLLMGKELASLVGGLPGAGTTVTGTAPPAAQRNPITGGLGGALAGAQIGSIIPGFGTGIGALLGGLTGAFA